MCGLISVVGQSSEAKVARGLKLMEHRGFRSSILPVRGGCAGHRRLPIVGVGEAHDQPVRRGRWVITFVGEILNFREIDPKAECDVDLVADTWAERGPAGFSSFDGFWTVVAHDVSTGEVHVLTDYLGQKPTYVRDGPDYVAVASELDSLACLSPVELDQTYLSAVVKWGYCPEVWRTPYEGVVHLAPGSHVVMTEAGFTASGVDSIESVGSTLELFKAEVNLAVRRRVKSADVGVSCLLSGGLDSSIVRVLAGRHGKVKSYHAENGEVDYCAEVDPKAWMVHLNKDINNEKCLQYMQEPIDLGSLVPQVALSDAIRGIGDEIVCLTGDGADEMFGGYGRAERYDSQASDVYHELFSWHLPRLDRVMMRNAIEVRSPFLARRVVQIALGMPRSWRVGKACLKEAFAKDLPKSVVDRAKKPLRTPVVEAGRESNSAELVRLFIERSEKFQ